MALARPAGPMQTQWQAKLPMAQAPAINTEPSIASKFAGRVAERGIQNQLAKSNPLAAADPTGGLASGVAAEMAPGMIGNLVGGWFKTGGSVNNQLCEEWAIGPDGNLFCVTVASGKHDVIHREAPDALPEGMSDAERAVADIDKQRLWDQKAFANANARYGQEAVQDALMFGGGMGPLSVDAAGVAKFKNKGGEITKDEMMAAMMGGMEQAKVNPRPEGTYETVDLFPTYRKSLTDTRPAWKMHPGVPNQIGFHNSAKAMLAKSGKDTLSPYEMERLRTMYPDAISGSSSPHAVSIREAYRNAGMGEDIDAGGSFMDLNPTHTSLRYKGDKIGGIEDDYWSVDKAYQDYRDEFAAGKGNEGYRPMSPSAFFAAHQRKNAPIPDEHGNYKPARSLVKAAQDFGPLQWKNAGGDVKKPATGWDAAKAVVKGGLKFRKARDKFLDDLIKKPVYKEMGGMTPGPLGMSDMLAAGKGKDVSKVTYKKKGGEIEDVMEISYHAPLAPKGE